MRCRIPIFRPIMRRSANTCRRKTVCWMSGNIRSIRASCLRSRPSERIRPMSAATTSCFRLPISTKPYGRASTDRCGRSSRSTAEITPSRTIPTQKYRRRARCTSTTSWPASLQTADGASPAGSAVRDHRIPTSPAWPCRRLRSISRSRLSNGRRTKRLPV